MFIKLVQNIRSVDFSKPIMTLHPKKKYVVLELEKDIKIDFIHYKDNPKIEKPLKRKGTLYRKNIIQEYFRDMYFRRLNRMTFDKFIFIMSDWTLQHTSIQDRYIRKFMDCEIGPNDKKVVVTHYEQFWGMNSQNCLVVPRVGNLVQIHTDNLMQNKTFLKWIQRG